MSAPRPNGWWRLPGWLPALVLSAATAAVPAQEVGVIVGAPGEPEYQERWMQAAEQWRAAAERAGLDFHLIGTPEAPAEKSARAQLEHWLIERRGETDAALWLVYVGHGTFDGRNAYLNLHGPDVSAAELAEWLQPLRRPLIFVHGGSASAPFLPALAGPDRIIITATRSGQELNYARFGEHFAGAVADPGADIDQDGQTSALEAFVTAAQQVQAYYAENNRLATEHALIDDNGDGHGTPAEWFRGTRLEREPEAGREADGNRARLVALLPTDADQNLSPEQRRQREQWERELIALRNRKAEMPEDDYYEELERIARELAKIYHRDS